MIPVPIGMVGVGNFGRWRRDRLRQTGRFRLVACYDRNPEALAAATQQEGCEPSASYDALTARTDIAGIVISTGADTHADLAIRAARAGKHVFVEKPLCTTADELQALLATADSTGVCMGMGHVYPNTVHDHVLRQCLDDGRIGTVTAISMNTSHGGGWLPSAWRFDPEKNPGGMLFHCGIHYIYWVQALFGPVTEVACMMRDDVNPATATSDATTVLLRLASGILVTLQAHHVTAYEHARTIYGTNGTLALWEFPDAAYYQARVADGGTETQVPINLSAIDNAATHGLSNLINWANAIQGEGHPQPDVYDGAQALAVVFAAAESGRSGRFVAVQPIHRPMTSGTR